jgi:hypothetical protein
MKRYRGHFFVGRPTRSIYLALLNPTTFILNTALVAHKSQLYYYLRGHTSAIELERGPFNFTIYFSPAIATQKNII